MALRTYNPKTPGTRQLVLTKSAVDALEARFK